MEKTGWERLLSDPFFDHMEGSLSYEAAQRLLSVIGEEFYLKGLPYSPDDRCLAVPRANVRMATIGFKSEMAKTQLAEWCRGSPSEEQGAVETTGWLGHLFDEPQFQAYAFQLLDSLIAHTQKLLPDNKQTLSYEARAKATAQDNAKELEDEIKRVEAARKSAEEAREAADSAKATAESIMPNMLTTLGVFIAIVIAVVACYLSLILSTPYIQASPGEAPKTMNIVMLLLMGHVLLDIIFLLLYLISKMSAHPLSCHCLVGDQTDCQKCDPQLRARCRFRHKLWQRYPYVVAMNGAFVASYCVLGLWYLVRRYFGASIDEALAGSWQCAAGVVGIAAALMAAAAIFVFRFFLRSPQHKVEAVQNRERKKAEATEKKEQKAENERRAVRKLREGLNRQENQITELEQRVNGLTEQLEQYQTEKDGAPAS